jgi:hypothetical protein
MWLIIHNPVNLFEHSAANRTEIPTIIPLLIFKSRDRSSENCGHVRTCALSVLSNSEQYELRSRNPAVGCWLFLHIPFSTVAKFIINRHVNYSQAIHYHAVLLQSLPKPLLQEVWPSGSSFKFQYLLFSYSFSSNPYFSSSSTRLVSRFFNNVSLKALCYARCDQSS